jgi:hypothetical protein
VLYENIAGVAATDAHTVEFRLKRPDPLFCGSVVFTMSGNILSRKAFDERADKFALDPICTGPFRVEHVDHVKGISLSAFKDHFAGAAATPKLEVRYILDSTARTLAFLSGQVNIIEGARTPGWLQSIKQRKPDTIFDGTRPGSVNTLHLNLTRKPLDDLRVRQAIRFAIGKHVSSTRQVAQRTLSLRQQRVQWRRRATQIDRARAARMKRTSGRDRQWTWQFAADCRLARASPRHQLWRRKQQRLRVGVRRRIEHRIGRPDLDDLAQIHHRDAMGEMAHHAQIVRDKQDRQAQPLLQLQQQVEDLRLHRDIQ